MADIIDYELIGSDLQIVEIELDPGESVRAETGAMCYMEDDVQMQTGTGGGIFSGLKRMVTGDGFFITSFSSTASSGKRRVAFAAPYPGKIVPLDLSRHGGTMLCQKDAFLCAAAGTDIDVAFTKRFGAGLFGGEGFILQRLSGDGLAFVHAGGTVVRKELAPGQSLRVDTGCLVAFEESVDYDIKFVGGFKNALFGGEGVFLAELKGPGVVFLQSLPLSRLVDRLGSAIGHSRGEVKRGGNSLLGNLLNGD